MSLNTNDVTLIARHRNNATVPQLSHAEINCFNTAQPERVALEKFINSVFKRYYNTEIEHFYPHLLSIETQQSIKAVAGIRCAAEEGLFSEHYLSNSLEIELKKQYGHPVSRHDIVEVGNLAPANVGQMRWLIASITAFLYAAGFKYIIFTIVPGIYNAFKRMDLPLRQICEAKQECLPADLKEKWGADYYQLKPKVFSGDIVEGFTIMNNNIYQSNKKLIKLFDKAYKLGLQYRFKHHTTSASCLFDQLTNKGHVA